MSGEAIRAELVEGARRWLGEVYGEERRRRTLANGAFDEAAWREMAQLGWLALTAPEGLGGLGLGLGDLAALARAVGAANLPEPVSAVAGIAVPLLAEAAQANAVAAGLLAGLLDGSRLAVLAHGEPASGFTRDYVTTTLAPDGEGRRLDGAKTAVEGGARADSFLVTARGEEGLAVAIVSRDTVGVTVTEYRTIDGRRLADLKFDAVRLPAAALLSLADTAGAIDEALDRGALLATAEAVGAMEAAFEDTLAHLKTRKQFGRTLGSFQALQHRAVDMMIALEEARAVVEIAADTSDAGERRRAIATAKVVGSRSARRIAREGVQLHGGMGITEESRISHLFRRLVAAESLYGDRDTYLDRYRNLAAT